MATPELAGKEKYGGQFESAFISTIIVRNRTLTVLC